MLLIAFGFILAILIRKKLYKWSACIATMLSVTVATLGIILGLFAPVFYGSQTILKSTTLIPDANGIYLEVQKNTYYFNSEQEESTLTKSLSSRNTKVEIRVTNSWLNQLNYCVEYPRHDMWLISFSLLRIPRYYYEFCVLSDTINYK